MGGTLKSFIIRIYRQEKDNLRKIVVVVEDPEIEGKKAFTNLDDLWEIRIPISATWVAWEDVYSN